MSTTVLPQLQAIEAELASQESQIAAQLASIREQLSGIRTVMPMFTGSAAVTEDPTISSEKPEEGKSFGEEATVVEEPVAKEAIVSEAPKATKAKATASKKASSKKAASKKAPAQKPTAKKDGRTASWQKYTRPGVKNESIPDAVRLILATQPENDFKIVEVMDALFKEDMPKDQYLKARNRISNVLSGGVRAGDWYRGERSTYRMTAA